MTNSMTKPTTGSKASTTAGSVAAGTEPATLKPRQKRKRASPRAGEMERDQQGCRSLGRERVPWPQIGQDHEEVLCDACRAGEGAHAGVTVLCYLTLSLPSRSTSDAGMRSLPLRLMVLIFLSLIQYRRGQGRLRGHVS